MKFEGINSLQNSNFNISQPFTLVLTIKQAKPLTDEIIFGSYPGDDYSIFTDKKNELTVQCQKKIKIDSIDNEKQVIIIEYNGNNSNVFINNELTASGKLNTFPLEGLLFGRNNKNNPDFFTGYLYECGIFNTIISANFRADLYNLLK
jgi:hypothetical protein